MSFEYLFSGDLYRARIRKGVNQQWVADAISLSLRQYQNIESGKAIPKLKTFLKLVYLFELDINRYREALDIHVPVLSN